MLWSQASQFDSHHSFIVRYTAAEDLGLDMHTDDSVTWIWEKKKYGDAKASISIHEDAWASKLKYSLFQCVTADIFNLQLWSFGIKRRSGSCCSGHHLQRVPRCGPQAADLKNLTGLARREMFQALTLQGPPWHSAAIWVLQTIGRPHVFKEIGNEDLNESGSRCLHAKGRKSLCLCGRSMEVQFFQNTNTFLRIIDQTMSVSPLRGFTCLPSRGMADFTGLTEWDF